MVTAKRSLNTSTARANDTPCFALLARLCGNPIANAMPYICRSYKNVYTNILKIKASLVNSIIVACPKPAKKLFFPPNQCDTGAMHVLYLSRTPPLALPSDVVVSPASGLFSGLKLRRQRPDAVIFATPALQTSGAWPQIGLCAAPEDAYRYRPGTHLIASTQVCAGQLARKGRNVTCLPLPMPEMASPVPATAPHLLAVAPFTRASGLDVLLKSVAGIPDLAITLAGSGPMQADLVEIARDLALRVNFIAYARVEDYQAATLVIHPVRADLEGSAIRAAMAAGRPIVATATDAARELIMANETGMLVPPADGAAIAHSIRLLLDDPAMALELARAAHEFYQAHFNSGLLHDRWQRYLAQLTAPAAPAPSKENFNVRRKL